MKGCALENSLHSSQDLRASTVSTRPTMYSPSEYESLSPWTQSELPDCDHSPTDT